MAKDYQQAKIYCIKVNTEEEYLPYVGSSCKRLLSQRMNQHRDDYKKWKNGKYGFLSSFTLFEKYGVQNCYIELIESFPCNTSDELRKKEREHIEKQECVNIVKKPFRTIEEEIIYKKNWNKNNNSYVEKYQKEHKEEITEYKSNYYQKNKEEISEKGKETYECPCGSICRKVAKARHERSIKHQKYLTTIGTLCSTTVA